MDIPTYVVYIHMNKVNGKVYVGITCQKPSRRFSKGNGYRECPKFWNAIKKYGWNGFLHIIYRTGLTEKEAKELEIELISSYKSFDIKYGYNTSKGGDGYRRPNKKSKTDIKLRQKLYNETHRDEIKQHQKEYNRTHRDSIRTKQREYDLAHKAEKKLYMKRWRAEHKEELKLWRKQYDEKHKDIPQPTDCV